MYSLCSNRHLFSVLISFVCFYGWLISCRLAMDDANAYLNYTDSFVSAIDSSESFCDVFRVRMVCCSLLFSLTYVKAKLIYERHVIFMFFNNIFHAVLHGWHFSPDCANICILSSVFFIDCCFNIFYIFFTCFSFGITQGCDLLMLRNFCTQ